MTRQQTAPRLDTWPFFAPSRGDAIEAALDVAGAGHGTGVLDLGCGDGQIVAAAARRGATAGGIEADPELVAAARRNLADVGMDADIRLGDLFSSDIDLELADVDETVLVAYLAPATLQRLLPALLDPVRRRRLVTIDFDVPGLVPTKRSGAARLYRLPGRPRRVGTEGWPAAGTLVAVAPDCQSLSCLELVHPGGRTGVRLSREFAGLASVLSGADRLDHVAHLAVDLRWEPMEVGTVALGTIRSDGVDDHTLVMVVTDEADDMWDLEPDAVDSIRDALQGREPPTTLAGVLAAAE